MLIRRYEADAGVHTLVWIHGLGESGLCFERIVATAPLDRYRHIVPDLPVYGRSAWPSQPPSLGATAATLADLIAGEGAPVTLVGHSLGGVLALLVARDTPADVSMVVEVEGNNGLGGVRGLG